MKPLAQMTRDELWSLDSPTIYELMQTLLKWDAMEICGYGRDGCLKELDTLRLELQQSAAEARRESLEELTVDEEKQIKYDYAKASAKINPQD